MYAISHIEAKPGIWRWAVSFRRRGKAYNRHFYYASRGLSKKEALTEAVAWRDRQLSRVRALSKREFCQIVRKSNHSGRCCGSGHAVTSRTLSSMRTPTATVAAKPEK